MENYYRREEIKVRVGAIIEDEAENTLDSNTWTILGQK